MTAWTPLDPPRIERRSGFLLAGIRRHYKLTHDLATIMQGVSRQWLGFRPRKREIVRAVSPDTYGVCLRMREGDAGIDYFCGMQVPDSAQLPHDLVTLSIPPLRYAIFRHTGPKSLLPNVYFTIFGSCLAEAGVAPAHASAGAPEFIELFDQQYDVKTETGGPVILVPVQD